LNSLCGKKLDKCFQEGIMPGSWVVVGIFIFKESERSSQRDNDEIDCGDDSKDCMNDMATFPAFDF